MNSLLIKAATDKGNNMMNYGYWAHTNPITNETAWKFIKQEGYTFTAAGENLAKDYSSVDAIITGWLNSASHKKILLSDKYTETGIAVVHYTKDGSDKVLVVHLFAKPAKTSKSISMVLRSTFETIVKR